MTNHYYLLLTMHEFESIFVLFCLDKIQLMVATRGFLKIIWSQIFPNNFRIQCISSYRSSTDQMRSYLFDCVRRYVHPCVGSSRCQAVVSLCHARTLRTVTTECFHVSKIDGTQLFVSWKFFLLCLCRSNERRNGNKWPGPHGLNNIKNRLHFLTILY